VLYTVISLAVNTLYERTRFFNLRYIAVMAAFGRHYYCRPFGGHWRRQEYKNARDGI
jgi:hypothetical protein